MKLLLSHYLPSITLLLLISVATFVVDTNAKLDADDLAAISAIIASSESRTMSEIKASENRTMSAFREEIKSSDDILITILLLNYSNKLISNPIDLPISREITLVQWNKYVLERLIYQRNILFLQLQQNI